MDRLKPRTIRLIGRLHEGAGGQVLNLAFADARSLAGMNSDIPAIRLAGD